MLLQIFAQYVTDFRTAITDFSARMLKINSNEMNQSQQRTINAMYMRVIFDSHFVDNKILMCRTNIPLCKI